MARQKGKHTSDKNQYMAYKLEGRWLKNQIKRFERIVKRFPKDLEAGKTLNRLLGSELVYRRNNRSVR